MKSKEINRFAIYELPNSSKLQIQGGATEELFGAYHFLMDTENTVVAAFKQGMAKVVRKKPGRTI